MKTTVNINEFIKVIIQPKPKKKKNAESLYDLYLNFEITENGITTLTPPTISTGLSVAVKEWCKKTKRKEGKYSQDFNNELQAKVNLANLHLTDFRNENVKTCTQVTHEIETNLRTRITGKAQWGKKEELTAKQKQKTVDAVLEHRLRAKTLCKNRQQQYPLAVSHLHQFFRETKGATPLITNITRKDIIEFERWFRKTPLCTNGKNKGKPFANDTVVTRLGMIAALFSYAEEEMQILKQSPIPKKFVGTFMEHDKPVLNEEECLVLMQLPDERLSKAQQVAKYSLCFGLTTSMGLGDMRSLTREHLKYDRNFGRWYVKKVREKHRHLINPNPFTVVLTPTAKYALDKLRELAGGEERLFNLTSDSNLSKHYDNLTKLAGVNFHTRHYSLRHTYAVDFMTNDGTYDDLGEIMGNTYKNTKKYGKLTLERIVQKTDLLVQKSRLHQL